MPGLFIFAAASQLRDGRFDAGQPRVRALSGFIEAREPPLIAFSEYVNVARSADEILREPDDQIVIHGHRHPLAQRPLALACAPAVRNIAAPSIQPLSWAILVEQADRNAQGGDAPIARKLLGRVHEQRGNAPPPERPGDGDLVNQRNAAAPESGIVGLPHDRDVTDDIVTVRGDKACAHRLCVIGQITPRLGLAITYPLDQEPDG
jgi:hypothetical protein